MNLKNKNGITLISLIITIVIMLILAAVSINFILGDNGLFKKTNQTVYTSKVVEYKEAMKTEIVGADVEKVGDTIDEDIQAAIIKVSHNDSVQIGDEKVLCDNKYEVNISDLWRNRRYAVAKIGDVRYATLNDAVDAIPEDNTKTTIEMLDNFNVQDDIWIDDTKNVVLDLAGYTVSRDSSDTIENGGILEVKNGTITANGGNALANCEDTAKIIIDSNAKIQGNSDSSAAISNQGILNVLGGQVISNNNAILNANYDNYDASIVTCDNGAVLKSTSNDASTISVQTGTINLNNCTVENNKYSAISNAENGTVNLNAKSNVKITASTSDNQSAVYNGGRLNLNGGNVSNIGTVITNEGTLVTNGVSNVSNSSGGTTVYNNGIVTLTKGVFKNTGAGSILTNDPQGNVTISNDAILDSNYSGCTVYTSGTMTCQGGTIKNASNGTYSSLFNVGSTGTLNILNGTNTEINTPSTLVYTEGTVNAKNIILENNNATGVVINGAKNTNINLSEGTVVKSLATSSEVVYISGGTLTVADATVQNSGTGSAINVGISTADNTRGKLIMNNSLSNVTSVCSDATVYSNGTIDISNGSIKDTATGSALNAGPESEVTISGNALLENNNNNDYATLFIEKATVTMNGGTIRNLNASGVAKDISSSNGGTFIQNGGTIVGETWGYNH